MILTLCVVIAISIIYSTFRLGISPMPSSRKVIAYLLAVIPEDFSGTFVDIGSGWGTVCRAVARQFPHAQVIGIEYSPVPYFISFLCSWGRYRPLFRDFKKGIPEGDIYFTYLYPGGMAALSGLLPKKGVLISNAFALYCAKPSKTVVIGTFYKTPIYTYSWIFEKSSS